MNQGQKIFANARLISGLILPVEPQKSPKTVTVLPFTNCAANVKTFSASNSGPKPSSSLDEDGFAE